MQVYAWGARLGIKGKLLPFFFLGFSALAAASARCPFADLIPLLKDFPGLQLKSNEAKDFALVKEFLTGKAADWFQISIPLDPKKVDPYFVEMARLSGGQAFFGGGSDLIEVGLLGSPKKASQGEVNVIRPRKVYEEVDIDKEWTNHDVKLPAWGDRAAVEGRVGVNGESGRDLRLMVKNANDGKYLIEDQPFINVPFKHGHIVRVNEKGEARLFFRTREDFANFRAKKLTLPDEDRCPKDFHLQLIDRNGANYLRNTIKYGLIVYGRSADAGWSYTPKSRAIIQNWVNYLKLNYPKDADILVSDLNSIAANQNVSKPVMERILKEFQLTK